MATDLEKIVDDLSALTVLEAAELSKMLEEKWGVSAAAPVAVAAAGGGEVAALRAADVCRLVLKTDQRRRPGSNQCQPAKPRAYELRTPHLPTGQRR